jgi:hypothetical protein
MTASERGYAAMADSRHNDGVHVDNLHLRVPAGLPIGGQQLATQIGTALGEFAGSRALTRERVHVRISEHEFHTAPAEAIARAIVRQLDGGVR